MNYKSFIILFVALELATISCVTQTKKLDLQKTYRLKYSAELVLSETETAPVKFVTPENHLILDTYRNLNYSVLLSSIAIEKHGPQSNAILVVGRFLDGHPAGYKEKNASNDMEGGFKRREFLIEGWGIQVPFYEYPQNAVDGSAALESLFRTNLKSGDFQGGLDLNVMNFDKDKGFYWIGVRPELH